MARIAGTISILISCCLTGCVGGPNNILDQPLSWSVPVPQTPILSPAGCNGPIGTAACEMQLENATVIRSMQDGNYYWYYHVFDGSKYHVGVAYASSPNGPWTRVPYPMLESSASGWDKDSVACATVMEIERKFYMWYCGGNIAGPTEFTFGVGLAVADGPIGPWKKVGLMIPDFGYVSSVMHHDGLYWMYSEYPVKGQYSPWEHLLDGTTVTPDYGPVSLATALAPEGPWTVRTMVLTPGTEWESGGTMSGSVFQFDGRWQMLYAATKPPASGSRFDTHDMIGYAYSADGVQFSRSTRNPIISDPVISLGNVSTYVGDGNVYLFYTHRVNVPQYTESLGEIVLNDLPPK